MVGLSCLSQPLSTTTTPACRSKFGENGCLRGLQPSRAVHCCPSGKLSCSVRPRLAHVIMDGCARYRKPCRGQRLGSAPSRERVRVTDPLLDACTARHMERARVCFSFLGSRASRRWSAPQLRHGAGVTLLMINCCTYPDTHATTAYYLASGSLATKARLPPRPPQSARMVGTCSIRSH